MDIRRLQKEEVVREGRHKRALSFDRKGARGGHSFFKNISIFLILNFDYFLNKIKQSLRKFLLCFSDLSVHPLERGISNGFGGIVME